MATLRQLRAGGSEERFGFQDYVDWISTTGARFPSTTYNMGSPSEAIDENFAGYVSQVYKRNGIVFACMAVRQAVFSEVRFRFAQVREGKLGKLFGTEALGILERPWPNGTTAELATRMIQDADLAGQFYAVKKNGRLWRRNPAKMVIALDRPADEAEFSSVVGYLYYPGGATPGAKFHTYMPEDVCHWSPLPDPDAEYRGMSWLTPVLREIRADGAATDHKLEFFGNAATPNMVVKTPESVMTDEQFERFRLRMEQAHVGRGNRHKTLYLTPGADVTAIGHDFRQMDFSETQGRDETRIAAAAGVPAVIVGLKESLQGSSLNAGNYGAARRRFGDATMRPLFRSASSALESLVPAPRDAQLSFDPSQVAFFREDRKDAADIENVKAMTIKSLTDAGYLPESVVAAVEAEDMTLLKHSGLFSVQLQPAGSTAPVV